MDDEKADGEGEKAERRQVQMKAVRQPGQVALGSGRYPIEARRDVFKRRNACRLVGPDKEVRETVGGEQAPCRGDIRDRDAGSDLIGDT